MNAVEVIFRLVLEVTWRMSCVIAIFMALRFLLRGRVSPQLLYCVWIAAAIRLLVPLSIPVKWSPFNLIRIAHHDKVTNGESISREVGRDASIAVIPVHNLVGDVQTERRLGGRMLSVIQLAAYIWCVGVVMLLLGRVCVYLRFSSRLRSALTLSNSQNAVRTPDFGLGEGMLLVTDLVGTPALHGVLEPKILFPPGLLEKLSSSEIQLIILHELCHHRRRDLLSQMAIQAAQIMHWFNPLVWIAGRAARNDCELACDEQVVRRLGATGPEAYGAALLKILSTVSLPAATPLGVGIAESKVQIKRRIQMIMANRPSSLVGSCLGWGLLTIVIGLGATRESQAQQSTGTERPAMVPASSSITVTKEAPDGWWKNGSATSSYTVGVDREQMHNGRPAAYVRSIVPSTTGFGGMMQMCQAEKYVGQRLRYSGWMKTDSANSGGAHLWFRVDGKGKSTVLQFDNMDGREVAGTTDWHEYSIVLDVPSDASELAYGFFISGTGQAWVSGLKLEEVGLDVPSTNNEENKGRSLPEAPVNLEFSVTPLADASFVLGPQKFHDGDGILIRQVQATSPNLGTNDEVVVRGQYHLASRQRATLAFYVTHDVAGKPDPYSPTQITEITNGSGEFKLSYRIPYAGSMHLTFYGDPNGGPFGGVYFGTNSQMDRIKDWTLSDYN